MTRPRSPIVLSQSEAIAPKSSSASDARGVLSRWLAPRAEELTHAAPLDHPDRPLGELAGDVAPAMRAETPVEVPVDVHPCRSAPRRIGAALGVEGRLARRDARNGVGQPELALVHKVL